MTIIFPVAGKGTRFFPKTLEKPKCILPIRNKLMIQWALSSIYSENAQIIIISHEQQGNIIQDTLSPIISNACFIKQQSPLEGAAHTVNQAKKMIKDKNDIVIVDCDIHAKSHYSNKDWQSFDEDGSVLTFYSQKPTKSYVKLEDSIITEAIEKKVISNQAIGGIFHFRNGNVLLEAIDQVINNKAKTKGEYYVSTVLNAYINLGQKLISFPAEKFYDLGMPEGADEFEKLDNEEING